MTADLSKAIGLELLFALLLPKRHIPALEMVIKIGQQFEGTLFIAFSGKYFGKIITSLRCRYDGSNIFVTFYRFFKILFN